MRPPPPNHGRFSSEQEALQAVVQRLVDALHPASIYLFGSRAEGRARPDSDFDLLVVFDDEAPNADANSMHLVHTMHSEDRSRGISVAEEIDHEVAREAGSRGTTWSAMSQPLLAEAFKMRRAPGIVFVDGLRVAV